MREIKFRAWNVKNRSLFSVFGFNGLYVFADTPNGVGTENNPACTEDCVLEQFTGLHDKNGEEIYEGDVVRDGFDSVRTIKWFDNLGYDGRGAMHSGFYFDETYDGIGELNYHNHMTDCEILGNIHENPELLNAR